MSFSSQEVKNMLVISMPEELDKDTAAEFKSESEEWAKKEAKAFILDFKKTTFIDKPFYQALSEFKAKIQEDERALHSLYINKDLIQQIKSEGLNTVFNPIENLSEIASQKKQDVSKPQGVKLSAEFINPFLRATKNTFETQAKTKVKVEKAYLQKEPVKDAAIVGVMNLSGGGIRGNIALRFTEESFLNIYENMFNEKQEAINEEIQDAASELLNIIYGTAKSELNDNGFEFDQAIPKVITGDDVESSSFANDITIVMPFNTENGKFYLEVETLENNLQRSA